MDESRLRVTKMKGLKRTVRRLGSVLGHRKGVRESELLPYREAREQIYLPVYKWVLDNCLQNELQQLRKVLSERPVVLLDYQTNGDIADLKTPLSHAALVKRYLEDDWPV